MLFQYRYFIVETAVAVSYLLYVKFIFLGHMDVCLRIESVLPIN